MRICVVGPTYPHRGGIAHYTSLLSRALRDEYQVKVVSFKRLYPGFLFPGKTQFDTSGAPIDSEAEPIIDSMNPLTWSLAARAVRSFNPDLVLFQWWHPFFAPALGFIAKRLRRSAKTVFLCHNVVPHESGGYTRKLTRFAFQHGDAFIVHSEEDKANLLAMFPEAQVARTFHPTYDVFNTGGWDRDACRAELGVSGNVILFFGLVRKYKGLTHLIQAMPRVLEQIDASLLIVGEFYDDKTSYVNQIEELKLTDKVRVIDSYVPNEEVGKYFVAADVVALPYVSATQSGIVQIAYGFGKPVIATSVGGLPEVIEDGKTGFLVPPEDPDALADCIVSFFRTADRDELARNISKRTDDFSWRKMVELIGGLSAKEDAPCER